MEVYPKTAVLTALEHGPTSAMAFLAIMARKVQSLRQRIELRNVRSARERVLLSLDLRAGRERIVVLPGLLQDFAAELGLTREAFYRTLASLEAEGLIRRDGNRIELLGAA